MSQNDLDKQPQPATERNIPLGLGKIFLSSVPNMLGALTFVETIRPLQHYALRQVNTHLETEKQDNIAVLRKRIETEGDKATYSTSQQ